MGDTLQSQSDTRRLTRSPERIDEAALLGRARRSLSSLPRPFLRWAGSKRLLLSQIVPFLPDSYTRYFEPFLGGGSLLLLICPKVAVVSDLADDLIATWRAVRDDPEGVYAAATANPLTRDEFYRVRGDRSSDPVRRAGEFIYLNRGCFNGLYRVNARGEFNVPWGAPKSGRVVSREELQAVSAYLRSADLDVRAADFEAVLADAGAGDLVFLDPPYVTRHNNNGFVDYNEKLFSWEDQQRLAASAAAAQERGAYVLVTNADHEDIVAMYPTFKRHSLSRESTLAGARDRRVSTTEALLVGRPIGRHGAR